MRIQTKMIVAVALVAVAAASFTGQVFPQISPAFNEGVIEKNIPLVGKDDVVVRGVFNDQDFGFIVPKFVKVEEATVVVNFSHARELLPDLSSLTVYFNGMPLVSRFLTAENAEDFQLSLKVDPRDFIVGANTIRFSFFQRSLRTPCADMDNPINWSILHKKSFITIRYRTAATLSVGTFGEAFCKAGPLLTDDTAFLLDNDPDEHTLQAAAILANYLGRVSGRARNIRVLYKNEASADAMSNYNIIELGTGPGQDTTASLAWSVQAGNKIIFRITGPDTASVEKAASYIAYNDTAQMNKSVEIFSAAMLDGVRQKPATMARPYGTFKEMGYPDITVSGVFSRRTSFAFMRPANWKMDDGRIKFIIQYSTFLKPETSGVTIEINGTPVASKRFIGNPDRPLILTASIPSTMLDNKFFFVGVNLFLDIGQKDCNHQFKDKAWAVIKNNSRLLMFHRHRTYKDLSDFPSMLMKGENFLPSIIAVPDKPDADILSVALTLESVTGAMVPYDAAIPEIRYALSAGGLLKEHNIIAIGNPSDFTWYGEADTALPVRYDAGTGAYATEGLPGVNMQGNFAVMQIAPSPWDRRYIVSSMSAGGDGYRFLGKIFSDAAVYGKLSGDFAYASSEAKVQSFNLKLKPIQQASDAGFLALWLALVAAFSAVVVGVYIFIVRRK